MRKIEQISIGVQAVDNGGFMVYGSFEVNDGTGADLSNGASELLMALGGTPRKQPRTFRFFAPDSRRVGEYIQDILNKATLTELSGGR